MIFRQIDEIRDGRKTQTRRVVKPGETFTGLSVETEAGRMKWRVGDTYAIVPKRAAPGVGRIVLLKLRRERLQDITKADAQAEGVADVAAYRALWVSINGPKSWDDNPLVWVIGFKYVGEQKPAQSTIAYYPDLEAHEVKYLEMVAASTVGQRQGCFIHPLYTSYFATNRMLELGYIIPAKLHWGMDDLPTPAYQITDAGRAALVLEAGKRKAPQSTAGAQSLTVERNGS